MTVFSMFSFLKPQASADAERRNGDSARSSAGWFSRLKEGLATRGKLGGSSSALFGAARKLDEAFYEELETRAAQRPTSASPRPIFLIEQPARRRAAREGYTEAAELQEALRERLLELLQPIAQPLDVGSAHGRS